jgi:hypothetical protein
MLDTAKIPRGTARTRSPDDRLPMTPATASIPITVRTEITLVALPTHHRRRRPEPRAFNRGGVVRLRLDGNRQSVVGRMITTQSWGRSCGRQTGRSGPGGGLGVRGARMDRYANTCPWRTCRLIMALGRSNRKLTLAHRDSYCCSRRTMHSPRVTPPRVCRRTLCSPCMTISTSRLGSNGGPAPGDAHE